MSVEPRNAEALPGPVLNSTFQLFPAGGLFVNSTTPSARSRDQKVPALAWGPGRTTPNPAVTSRLDKTDGALAFMAGRIVTHRYPSTTSCATPYAIPLRDPL